VTARYAGAHHKDDNRCPDNVLIIGVETDKIHDVADHLIDKTPTIALKTLLSPPNSRVPPITMAAMVSSSQLVPAWGTPEEERITRALPPRPEKIGRHDITSAINDRIRKYHLEYPAQAGDFDRSGSKASH
jgi:hypothetical protein